MKLAMYQMKNAGSMDLNLEKSLNAVKEVAENHADMILFPEVQLTEFFPQFESQDKSAYQITLDSPIVKAFQEACKKNHIMAVPNLYLKSYGRKDGKKVYDASLLIDQDGKIGIVVCFDRHYPESIRTEALMGADCILVPTANTKTEPMEMFEQKISESGKLLLSIINNMSRIESGKVELDESYVNVTDTVGRINGVFEEDIKKKGIHFTHEVDVQHPYIRWMCSIRILCAMLQKCMRSLLILSAMQ